MNEHDEKKIENAAETGESKATPSAESKPADASAAAAPSQQELAIRGALETVMDPEIGLSVIDLGLIREVLLDVVNP